jgi:long-chain acyl-CoA synthetase
VFSKPDDVGAIMYTSGSTETPTGCVITQSAIVAGSAGFQCVPTGLQNRDTSLSFLSLVHVYVVGAAKDLLDDMRALQPTIIVAVPRIPNRGADAMRPKVAPLQTVVRAVIRVKSQAVVENRPHSLMFDVLLLSKFRAAFGGKVRLIVNGGAPIRDRYRRAFGSRVVLVL